MAYGSEQPTDLAGLRLDSVYRSRGSSYKCPDAQMPRCPDAPDVLEYLRLRFACFVYCSETKSMIYKAIPVE